MAPLQEELYDLYKQRTEIARAEGRSEEEIEAMKSEFDPNYMPRIPERYADRQLDLDQQEAMEPISGPRGRGATRAADDATLKQRKYFTIENEHGQRALVKLNDKSGMYELVKVPEGSSRVFLKGTKNDKTDLPQGRNLPLFGKDKLPLMGSQRTTELAKSKPAEFPLENHGRQLPLFNWARDAEAAELAPP